MNKKFILHPGIITSRLDGEDHYINAGTLAKLHKVDINECIIMTSAKEMNNTLINGVTKEQMKKMINLYPNPNEIY